MTTESRIEINGVAHVMLTVTSMARSRDFYVRLLSALGLTQVVDTDEYLYFVGGRTAVGLRPAAPEHAAERFAQGDRLFLEKPSAISRRLTTWWETTAAPT